MKFLPNLVDTQLCTRIVDRIWLDVSVHGLSAREIIWWRNEACWFPHLRFLDEIVAIRETVAAKLSITGQYAEPQIFLQFPSSDAEQSPEHVDRHPDGRSYEFIMGIALSCAQTESGQPMPQVMRAGDAILLQGDEPHGTRPNKSGQIRHFLYLRWFYPEA